MSKTESCDRKPVIDLPAGILQLTEISTNFNVLCVAMVQHNETRLHASLPHFFAEGMLR